MDDILERIYRARIGVMRQGRDPETLYIGQEEAEDLWAAARGNGAVTIPGLTMDGRTRVFNMPVYIVDASSYLRVV